MKEVSLFLFGLFLFTVGIFSLVLTKAIGGVDPELLSLLGFKSNLTGSLKLGFMFMTLTGILYMLYPVAKGHGWKYRIYLFSGSVLSAITSAIFFVKLIGVGPGWLGEEMLGISGGNLTKVSLILTFLPVVSFIGGFTTLLSEMEF